MKVDEKLITYLEDLSCLALSVDEKIRMEAELQNTLDSMADFGSINTDGIAECSNPLDKVNVFREDEAHASAARELILKNAPNKNDEMIIAPKTVE